MASGDYVGSYASLNPDGPASYGELFTGYRMPASKLGFATSIQTANQIDEVTKAMNQGTKQVELSIISPEVFEAIPRQQFKEIRQLTKLSGASVSMHAPMVDPSGFDQQKGFNEAQREEAERHLMDAVRKAHETDPTGNIPVTIHASGMPAMEWKMVSKGKEKEFVPISQVVVNADTGEMTQVKAEEIAYRLDIEKGIKEKEFLSTDERIEMQNLTEWKNSLLSVVDYKMKADELLQNARSHEAEVTALKQAYKKGVSLRPDEMNMLRQYDYSTNSAEQFYSSIYSRVNDLYDRARKFLPDKKKDPGAYEENLATLKEVEENWRTYAKMVKEETRGLGDRERREYMIKGMEKRRALFNDTLQRLETLREPPRVYQPVEEYALGKASQTFGKLAFDSYKEFKDKAPIISVENFQPNMAFSRADSLRSLIKESRKVFVDKAVKDGMSREKAEKEAAKMIGVTWDVAHINLLRKYGYTEKQIIEETQKIAPYVKHVHMVDNFGFNDSHLPVGMGNVPIKEMMQELKEAGFEGKAVSEAAGFVQHFKTSPRPYELEALGSQIYYPAGGPTWSEARTASGGYFSGYGMFLPEQHFSMYGGGFSTLPIELGGKAPGKGSQFSGAPME